MNTFELYKLLPKTNCGKCHQKLCMPFSFAVTKGDADISECPSLNSEEVDRIRSSLVKSDWRETLIANLKADIGKIPFLNIAEGIGADLVNGSLRLNAMNKEFTISSKGEIKSEGHITPWLKILLLNYIKNSGNSNLSNKWVSFSELKNGMLKANTFKSECEDALNSILNDYFDKSDTIFSGLGARRLQGLSTENAWTLKLLPKIPVLILYWQKEDDFPSQTKILFDSSADQFLDVESLVFLTEEMIREIETAIETYK